MATVIGVRFRKTSKVYYFDPNGLWPAAGDSVVVETSRGVELGDVVATAREIADEEIVAPLKKALRMATERDLQTAANNERREPEAFRIGQEKIAEHGLDMKLVNVEYTFDASKIIFYFSANARVDFRDLVKDLAGIFKMRIELRQIHVRDEAKMLGGLGICGRPICCDTFLTDFQSVSIKMAKEQNLSLNPTKISGQCGRLMCCLKYEQDYYEQTLKKLPKLGRDIMTPDGIGVVTDINVIQEKVRVRIRTADDTFDVRSYSIDDVRKLKPEEQYAAPAPNLPEKPVTPPVEKSEDSPKPTKRTRVVRKKVPKTLNTDQYMALYGEASAATRRPSATEVPADTESETEGRDPDATAVSFDENEGSEFDQALNDEVDEAERCSSSAREPRREHRRRRRGPSRRAPRKEPTP